MASYNTIPAPAAEEPLLQEPIKKSSRKYVVLGAALASFALGALALTAASPEVASTGPMEMAHWCDGTWVHDDTDCDDINEDDEWSSCDWVESNAQADAGDGEFYLGKVDSPDECIKLAMNAQYEYSLYDEKNRKCVGEVGGSIQGYTVANVDSDGSGKCYCQYLPFSAKGEIKPDNEGWMSCSFMKLNVPFCTFNSRFC